MNMVDNLRMDLARQRAGVSEGLYGSEYDLIENIKKPDLTAHLLKTNLRKELDDMFNKQAWLGIAAEAAFNPKLLDDIVGYRQYENELYRPYEYDVNRMTSRAIQDEANFYGKWSDVRGMDTEARKSFILAERKKRRDRLMPKWISREEINRDQLTPEWLNRDLLTPEWINRDRPMPEWINGDLLLVDKCPKNNPTVRASNSLYLSEATGLDINESANLYDLLVYTFFGKKDPTDIRPMSRMVRQWYFDQHLRSRNIEPSLYRAARKFTDWVCGHAFTGQTAPFDEDIDWQIVLQHIPPDEKDEFLRYVLMVSSPKDRSGLSKIWTTLARSTGQRTRLLTDMEMMSNYEESDRVRSVIRRGYGMAKEDEEYAADIANREAQYERQAMRAAVSGDPIKGETFFGKLGLGTSQILPDWVAAGASSAMMGSPLGAFSYWYKTSSMDTYDNMKQLGFDEQTSMGTAQLVAVPVSLINVLQMNQMFAGLSSQAKERTVKAAQLGLVNYIGKKAVAAGSTYFTEMGEEATESLFNVTGIAIADALKEDNPKIDWWNDVINPELNGLKQAMWGIGGLVLFSKGTEVSGEVRYIRQLTKSGIDKQFARSIAHITGEGKVPIVESPVMAELPNSITDQIRAFSTLSKENQDSVIEDAQTFLVNKLLRERTDAVNTFVQILEQNGIKGVIAGETEVIEGATEGQVQTGAVEVTEKGHSIAKFALGSDEQTGAHEAMHVLETVLNEADLRIIDVSFKTREDAAIAFSKYYKEKTGVHRADTIVSRIWNGVIDTVKRIRNKLRGLGYRSYEDIFGQYTAGEYNFGKTDVKPAYETKPDTATATAIRRKIVALTEIYSQKRGRTADVVLPEIKQSIKRRIKKSTDQRGITNVGELVSEYDALTAAIKKAKQSSDITFKAVKEAGDAEITRIRGELKAATKITEKKALAAALKKAEQSARKAYSVGKKEGVQKEKAHYQEMLARQQELKQDKGRLDKALSVITRAKTMAASKTANIDFVQKQAIAVLTTGLTPKTRSKKTMEQRMRMLQFLQEHTEAIGDIPAKKMRELNNRVANDYTLEELEWIADEVKKQIHLGNMKYKLKKKRRAEDIVIAKESLKNKVLQGEELETPPDIKVGKPKETVAKKGKKIVSIIEAESLRPSQLFDLLDGGHATYDGLWYKTFVDEVNDAEDSKLVNKYRRSDAMDAQLAILDIKPKELVANVVVPGVELSPDGGDWTLGKMMGVYIANQNEKSGLAIMYGNGLSEQDIAVVINKLPEKLKKLGDYIIADYEVRLPALREAIIANTNHDLVIEPRYSPACRVEGKFETLEQELVDEIIYRQNLKKASPKKSFSIERKNIAPEHQGAIRLDALTVWFRQVEIQEHYIAYAGLVKKLQAILGDKEIMQAIEQKKGKPVLESVQNYTNRIANPDFYNVYSELDNMSRRLRRNTALAYLSFNMLPTLKQLTSLSLYLGDTTLEHMLMSTVHFMANPKAMMDDVKLKDPQIRNVVTHRELAEAMIAMQGHYSNFNQIKRAGMKGLQFLDSITRVIGWNSVYTKAIADGKSEVEAIRLAKNSTLRTQNTAAVKDLPQLYTHGEMMNWMLLFSNQQNQIWNIITYDIPRKTKSNPMAALNRTVGMGLCAALLWIIDNRDFPDELEELWEAGMSQTLSSIPLIGSSVILSRGRYYNRNNPVISGFGRTISNIATGNFEKAINPAAETAALFTGFPYIATKRVLNAFEEGDITELAGRRKK